ncbi:DUF4258 domain-containing protein [Bradyrhizobium sp. AUGA SZCCT0240]|uniref:DUF4258 domain-containing protein n=1 Tax=unclassified Bradyrhizobium TaxID=2631580 RepID=UPI001BA857F8|nr:MULTISPECIES: DUF4258 domain-containing protein [unclassified Bradyrhizobium]MBR1189051.1 DUF4258 domain-containing protein [Bradyrhizobium sp. AUGA SZCCT0160]MBR1199378.1 DUF4258 domain-containing protein [Bradyrhizobium sp. AUGA SZCCT0158]MBR1243329.1 DUF4258 domain-containing protein [Bradyrhizobium sp. AUGA SZCCT0274]MBR1254819.1 DUF4258 domain-containing protein [Bradyrhizobium sp. AUGA SZCCT0240]
MSDTLTQIQALVTRGLLRISDHGYDELAKDDILVTEVLAGIDTAVVVEDYPAAMRGPSVLVLQWDILRRPVHVVWAIPKDQSAPAVLVTAYRPDQERWSSDFMRRKK